MDIQQQTSLSPDLEAQGWKPMRGGGFSTLVGPFYAKREGDRWAYAFQSGEQHENRQGAIHGGMLMTFADHALGVIAFEAAQRRKCVTMQLDTQFLSAGLPGDFLECRSEAVRAARSVIFMRGLISVGDRPVLSATGIWKVVGP